MATIKENLYKITKLETDVADLKNIVEGHLKVADYVDDNVTKSIDVAFDKIEKNVTAIQKITTRTALLENRNKLKNRAWENIVKWIAVVMTLMGVVTGALALLKSA